MNRDQLGRRGFAGTSRSANSMKIKLDENLPQQIAVELRARAHDAQTVGEEGLTGWADADVCGPSGDHEPLAYQKQRA